MASKSILVAAIDFGTTYSGAAISFCHEYERDPTQIYALKIGNTRLSMKSMTCILIKPDGTTCHKFGEDADTYYHEELDEHERKDWFFFQRFKMQLYDVDQHDMKHFQIKDKSGKKLPAIRVFSLAIRYLKDQILEHCNSTLIAIVDISEIGWVLTVPAIWNDKAKAFMREAAEEAGIARDKLVIALEPEAASIYCQHIPLVRDQPDIAKFVPFQPGIKYAVVDCGGGTVDITVHEVSDQMPVTKSHHTSHFIKEVHRARGNNMGGMKVDKAFLDYLNSIIVDYCKTYPCENGGKCNNGASSYTCACVSWYTSLADYCKTNPCENGGTCNNGASSYTCACVTDYCGTNPCENGGTCNNGASSYTCACVSGDTGTKCTNLGADVLNDYKQEDCFRDLMHSFEEKKRMVTDDSRMRISTNLFEVFSKKREKSLKEHLVEIGNKEIVIQGNKLRISSTVAKSFFDKSISSIIVELKAIFKSPDVTDCSIILLVGGYSECSLLQKRIKETFHEKTTICPNDAGLAVLKGAVIFGHNPGTISERISRFTYGTGIRGALFSKLVKIGDRLVVGKANKVEIYYPRKADQTSVDVAIYISPREDPVLLSEDGCMKIMPREFPIPDTTGGCSRKIEMCMIFGGTEFKVKVKDCTTGHEEEFFVSSWD